MKAIASASSRVLSVLSTPPVIGTREMRFDHFRRVGSHQGDRVPDADPRLRERRGEPAASRIGLRPRVAALAVDHREMARIGVGRARDQRQRRQRRVVGGIAIEVAFERIGCGS